MLFGNTTKEIGNSLLLDPNEWFLYVGHIIRNLYTLECLLRRICEALNVDAGAVDEEAILLQIRNLQDIALLGSDLAQKCATTAYGLSAARQRIEELEELAKGQMNNG